MNACSLNVGADHSAICIPHSLTQPILSGSQRFPQLKNRHCFQHQPQHLRHNAANAVDILRGPYPQHMLFKHLSHPILWRKTLGKVKKLVAEFVHGLQRVPRGVIFKQLRQLPLTHRKMRGDVMLTSKITRGPLEFPTESISSNPGIHGHIHNFHLQGRYIRRHQHAFSVRAVPFWNKMPAEIANASSVLSHKTLLDANWRSLSPEVPI